MGFWFFKFLFYSISERAVLSSCSSVSKHLLFFFTPFPFSWEGPFFLKKEMDHQEQHTYIYRLRWIRQGKRRGLFLSDSLHQFFRYSASFDFLFSCKLFFSLPSSSLVVSIFSCCLHLLLGNQSKLPFITFLLIPGVNSVSLSLMSSLFFFIFTPYCCLVLFFRLLDHHWGSYTSLSRFRPCPDSSVSCMSLTEYTVCFSFSFQVNPYSFYLMSVHSFIFHSLLFFLSLIFSLNLLFLSLLLFPFIPSLSWFFISRSSSQYHDYPFFSFLMMMPVLDVRSLLFSWWGIPSISSFSSLCLQDMEETSAPFFFSQ